MKERALELLESLMTGHEIDGGELDMMLKDRVSEKLHLEYKHGNELKKADASKTIRQYVSGFANADGGILIVGVDEKTWRVTGCPKSRGPNLAQWAATCVTPIASYFSPPPRFYVVNHPKGQVLVVATYRSLNLVPCTEAGRQIYYFRFHDQSLSAPDYLISDLVLGRRQHPFLRIQKVDLRDCRDTEDAGKNRLLQFRIGFMVGNEGLLSAERVSLGIVSWVRDITHVVSDTLVGSSNDNRLSDHLLSYVEVQNVDEARYTKQHALVHLKGSFNEIEPFTVKNLTLGIHIQIPILDRSCVPYTLEAAVYLMPSGSPPVWYQQNIQVDFGSIEKMSRGIDSFQAGFVTINPCMGTRPRIAWSGK